MFEYIGHKYLFRHSLVSILFEYIRTFVHAKFVCTNIFRHWVMSVLECKNKKNILLYLNIHTISIQIFIQTFLCVKFVIQICSDIRVNFLIQICSDICLYQNFHKCHTLYWMHIYFTVQIQLSETLVNDAKTNRGLG